MRGRRKSYAYFFILPGCLILLMFTILAAALAFGFSFMDFNLLRPKDAAFVGFEKQTGECRGTGQSLCGSRIVRRTPRHRGRHDRGVLLGFQRRR